MRINENKIQNSKNIQIVVYADRQRVFDASFNNNPVLTISLIITLQEILSWYELNKINKNVNGKT